MDGPCVFLCYSLTTFVIIGLCQLSFNQVPKTELLNQISTTKSYTAVGSLSSQLLPTSSPKPSILFGLSEGGYHPVCWLHDFGPTCQLASEVPFLAKPLKEKFVGEGMGLKEDKGGGLRLVSSKAIEEKAAWGLLVMEQVLLKGAFPFSCIMYCILLQSALTWLTKYKIFVTS